jgi:hypothetical protein
MASSDKPKTFLADDGSSIYSEEFSIPDSESPRTPHTPEKQPQGIKLFHLPSHNPTLPSKFPDNGRGHAESREMTLRMTLTRPDLRSYHEELCGWEKRPVPRQASRSSHTRSFQTVTPVLTHDTKDATNESMDKIFADIDRELSSSPDGIVKRFFKRVRRS